LIYSGLDWSGSPGATHGPWLVFAVVHIDGSDLVALDSELLVAKKNLRVEPGFVFKHDDAAEVVREEAFAALRRTPLNAHVHMLDKAAFRAGTLGKARGNDMLFSGILRLVMACPENIVARQILLVDPPSRPFVKSLRTAISKSFRGAHRAGFRDVRARRDDAVDGAIIQAADMIAGEVRRFGGLGGPFLPSLANKGRLV
jgi:hypothetical protein